MSKKFLAGSGLTYNQYIGINVTVTACHLLVLLSGSALANYIFKGISNYSNSDSNLLIYGETGTGKELFAQSIHNASHRQGKPFVAINCAALPVDLLESELFAYAEGAFTGAAKGGKMGLFEIAHTETIFLDEIGDISPKLQSRLLRVLQEREIIRVSHNTVIPIDVRVISATNRKLCEEVKKGNFRLDLLYRLDVLQLQIPPLRERQQDILFLVKHFIEKEQQKVDGVLRQITAEGLEFLANYQWYGNVRELRNFVKGFAFYVLLILQNQKILFRRCRIAKVFSFRILSSLKIIRIQAILYSMQKNS